MRASRVTIVAAFLFTSLLLLWSSRKTGHGDARVRNVEHRSRLLSFQTPLSLFPPNAIISLTDDNTTSFVARPAAFGPLLPSNGLSGQLWIGSGFGEDMAKHGAIVSGAEGELGCSDVPGWNSGKRISKPSTTSSKGSKEASARTKTGRRSSDKMIDADRAAASEAEYLDSLAHMVSDGTDDHLHRGLEDLESSGSHADIQSIQEGAEIAGKIVLLSRGGCGFLEKVKWVQRRGGVALIVGDDTKGGPLISMYAGGDTSNVSIPAIFTGWSTAHILSSFVPSGRNIEDTMEDSSNGVVETHLPKKTKKPSAPVRKEQSKRPQTTLNTPASKRKGWFPWSKSSSGGKLVKSSWVLVTEYNESEDTVKANPKSNLPATPATTPKPEIAPSSLGDDDDFLIGVQDWRDPDLVDFPRKGKKATSDTVSSKTDETSLMHTPPATTVPRGTSVSGSKTVSDEGSGFLSRLFGEDVDESETSSDAALQKGAKSYSRVELEEHSGLWVTLTPTSAASPFFDTLLVLVVSPLVTLTVVYALLLLRSRIRRRRWRAPKSVVERLPVRTYHTIPSSTTQTRLPSPTSSSPSTPLLSSPRPRPRSRTTSGIPEPGTLSRQNSDLLQPPSTMREPQHEKSTTTGGSEWKKYMGKQVECVVCLEEYIDGESRVMSLPCGHEFHVDCITPWLTIRRRTCPICKGDVVRSLARASSSTSSSRHTSPSHSRASSPSPRGTFSPLGSFTPYHRGASDEVHSEDVQAQAAETVNNSEESRFPVFTQGQDPESGDGHPGSDRSRGRTSYSTRLNGWRGLFGATSLRRQSLSQDRSR